MVRFLMVEEVRKWHQRGSMIPINLERSRRDERVRMQELEERGRRRPSVGRREEWSRGYVVLKEVIL
jgi:hypothetical protein